MKKTKKISIVLLVFLISIFSLNIVVTASSGNLRVSEITKEKEYNMEQEINRLMKDSKIPGVSVVVINNGNCVYKKGFGYSDVKEKKVVTSKSLFELGSTSKAFTALGILKLEKEGLINLNDSIDKYIPWLKMKYKGKDTTFTIEQALHHTSGVPFKSIASIPATEEDDALDQTVKTLVGKELSSKPGEKFLYATINYDVLGLIIKNVSKKSYEEYMEKNILKPMGLKNTYLFRKNPVSKDMTKGYKIGFGKALEYDAPMFRGNTPAGYFIANGDEIEKWLKVQLGTNETSKFDNELIVKSHSTNNLVGINREDSAYADGWFVSKNDDVIFHGGNNPNFSSSFILKPSDKLGVGVLSNMNSAYTDLIAKNIVNILYDKKTLKITSDAYAKVDKIAVATIFIVSLLITFITSLFILSGVQIFKGKRRVKISSAKPIFLCSLYMLLITILEYLLYRSAEVISQGLSWKFLSVWAPKTLIIATIEIGILIALSLIYAAFTTLFVKVNSDSYSVREI